MPLFVFECPWCDNVSEHYFVSYAVMLNSSVGCECGTQMIRVPSTGLIISRQPATRNPPIPRTPPNNRKSVS